MNVVLPGSRYVICEKFWRACLPRARPFSLSPTTSKRLLRRLTFHSHAHKTHFHMKGFALRAKREFLELGNGLFNKASWIINTVQIRHRSWLIHGSFAKVWNATFEPNSSICSAHAISSQLCTILVISRPRIPTRNRKRWLYARTCKRFIIELW